MATREQKKPQSSPAPPDQDEGKSTEERGLVSQVGPLEVDWPKALGYYGALGVALTVGFIEPPLALFIAAVPFFKMLNRPDSSQLEWITGQILDGAATPVGGSASPVMRVKSEGRPRRSRSLLGRGFAPLRSIWIEAHDVARGGQNQLPG